MKTKQAQDELWEEIEKNHPNYSSDERVAEVNDLDVILEGVEKYGDFLYSSVENISASNRFKKDYSGQINNVTLTQISLRKNYLILQLYQEAMNDLERRRVSDFMKNSTNAADLISKLVDIDNNTMVMIETTEPNGDAIGCFHCKAEMRDHTIVLVQTHI